MASVDPPGAVTTIKYVIWPYFLIGDTCTGTLNGKKNKRLENLAYVLRHTYYTTFGALVHLFRIQVPWVQTVS